MTRSVTILSLLCLVLLLVCALQTNGFAGQGGKAHIRWGHAYFPPVTIPYGPQQGQGFYDKITDFLIKKLPEYSHSFELSNYRRILHDVKNQDNVCCASLYKTPDREKFVSFSEAAVVVLPNGVIVRKNFKNSLRPYLDGGGKLQLEKALLSGEFKFGVAAGRAYSSGIDTYLNDPRFTQDKIERAAGADVFEGLMQMLFAGRVDFILGYPVEASYAANKLGKQGDYVFLPIAETIKKYTLGHVGCPNTIWGRAIIAKVDEILLNHRQDQEFLQYYMEWLDAETARSYPQLVSEIFGNESSTQN